MFMVTHNKNQAKSKVIYVYIIIHLYGIVLFLMLGNVYQCSVKLGRIV